MISRVALWWRSLQDSFVHDTSSEDRRAEGHSDIFAEIRQLTAYLMHFHMAESKEHSKSVNKSKQSGAQGRWYRGRDPFHRRRQPCHRAAPRFGEAGCTLIKVSMSSKIYGTRTYWPFARIDKEHQS
jgi:hypothetical protein